QQDTVAKDKAAWEQHEQQVAAMPAQLQADLEAKTVQAASTGAAATDQALAGLRAEVAAAPADFQKAVQQAIKQAAGTHAKAMDGLRSALATGRKDLDGKLQYVRDARAASADAQVKRLQAMLGAVGKVVAARLDELDKQIAKLPK
ncbi:hypothetical protein HQ576_19110, partial [bacterium]|nr:hypothetical protein [bacterium]